MKRRLQIIVEVEDSAELHTNLMKFVADNSLSHIQADMMHEAIENGAIVECIRSGRADINETDPIEYMKDKIKNR